MAELFVVSGTSQLDVRTSCHCFYVHLLVFPYFQDDAHGHQVALMKIKKLNIHFQMILNKKLMDWHRIAVDDGNSSLFSRLTLSARLSRHKRCAVCLWPLVLVAEGKISEAAENATVLRTSSWPRLEL